MARAAARRLLLALAVLLMVFSASEAGQNLRKTTCPICNMDVKQDINATILGDQFIYACEMAGHIDALQNEPANYLGSPEEADITTDVIYKDATEITCPVCGKPYSELTHAVPWITYGGQKIYACSAAHAQLIYSDPTSYVAKQAAGTGFCDSGSSADPRGSTMFDGFQLAIGGDATCVLLLFQPWVLSSAVKYAFGFLGVVLLGMSVEGMGEARDMVEKRFYRDYGIVFSLADYAAVATPVHSGDGSAHSASFNDALPNASKLTMMRRIPFWCKLALAACYVAHMALAYFAMLIVMTYESLMFVAVVIGLGLGFALFKDTEADVMGGNVDPCCST